MCPNLVEADADAQLQRRPEVKRAPQQQTRLGGLRGIQSIQRAVAAAAAIVGGVRAEAGVTEFLAAERPVNQEAQGGSLGPLPIGQFGSPDS
jgi:adenylate kinase